MLEETHDLRFRDRACQLMQGRVFSAAVFNVIIDLLAGPACQHAEAVIWF